MAHGAIHRMIVLGSIALAAACGGVQPAPVSEPAPQSPMPVAAPSPQPPKPVEKPQKPASRSAGPAPSAKPVESPSAASSANLAGDTRSSKEHMLEGVRLLEKGNAEAARSELVAALRRDPANEAAKDLLGQIDADPEEVLGKEHFSYTVQSGDSLSLIAKRFLKDPFRFFILARYNEIANPSELHVGAVIKVPGKRPAAAPAPPAPPVKEEPPAPKPSPSVAPKPPAPPPKQPEGEQSAERLYQSGLRALAAKTPEKALDLFQQALKAQPRHAGAEEKIREVKPLLADQYYKKALAASRRQNLDETIRNCNKVLELDPENEKAKLLRMQALDLQERVKKIK